MQKELVAIRRWLKIKGNTEAKLASELGYTSSVAVKMWFKRNNVPEFVRKRVMEIIQK